MGRAFSLPCSTCFNSITASLSSCKICSLEGYSYSSLAKSLCCFLSFCQSLIGIKTPVAFPLLSCITCNLMVSIYLGAKFCSKKVWNFCFVSIVSIIFITVPLSLSFNCEINRSCSTEDLSSMVTLCGLAFNLYLLVIFWYSLQCSFFKLIWISTTNLSKKDKISIIYLMFKIYIIHTR